MWAHDLSDGMGLHKSKVHEEQQDEKSKASEREALMKIGNVDVLIGAVWGLGFVLGILIGLLLFRLVW